MEEEIREGFDGLEERSVPAFVSTALTTIPWLIIDQKPVHRVTGLDRSKGAGHALILETTWMSWPSNPVCLWRHAEVLYGSMMSRRLAKARLDIRPGYMYNSVVMPMFRSRRQNTQLRAFEAMVGPNHQLCSAKRCFPTSQGIGGLVRR